MHFSPEKSVSSRFRAPRCAGHVEGHDSLLFDVVERLHDRRPALIQHNRLLSLR
jgi:hypothetical protein